MINFDTRLKSLKERRQGSRERAIVASMESYAADQAIKNGRDVRSSERYEALNETSGVKYAVGAMAAVDATSTRLSETEGNRVADSLIKSLNANGENVEKRMQGSVPLNIHIKGYSDVDMLIIVKTPVNIESPRVDPSRYSQATDPRPLKEIVRDVRRKSEVILPRNFPAANVEISNNKSIEVSGGSLSRKVDIVPAFWYDSIAYQRSGVESDRGIKIYHKSDDDVILNYPFKHINRVNDRDDLYSGNLKCVIRLMKNMIADMPDYKKSKAKKLSSYDLSGIGYHMGQALNASEYLRLGLVEACRVYLNLLMENKEYRESILVPDDTRIIFDQGAKLDALEILSKEMEDLAFSIFKELSPLSHVYDSSVMLNKAVY